MTKSEMVWISIGAVAQVCFGARMIVQWWASERQGRSVVPLSFWYLSVVASVLMLAYAVWRIDPVFIAGQILGLAVYGRNLSLMRRRGDAVSKTIGSTADEALAKVEIAPRSRTCKCACTCGASQAAKAA